MASSPSNSLQSNISPAICQQILSQFQGDWVEQVDLPQLFTLIDGVLPFEACLYYQVLPLFLEGTRLNLGMVVPDDDSALEYVRRIISYLNYSLVPHPISSAALQTTLSTYLNNGGNRQKTPAKTSQAPAAQRPSIRTRSEQVVDHSLRPTLLLDSPDDLAEIAAARNAHQAAPAAPPPQTPPAPAPIPDEPTEDLPSMSLVPYPATPAMVEREAAVAKRTEPAQSPKVRSSKTSKRPSAVSLIAPLQPLSLEAIHLASPVEALITLSPKEIVQELLTRVLLGGIGRLYFECHPHHGRVLWSQDGVLQSALDNLPVMAFNAAIIELKTMANLPPDPVSEPRLIEVEHLYDQTRVLLRFQFMPGRHGEEATLQVLRGAALKFYQQQQIARLERDALSIARQLQNKLNQLRDRAQGESNLSAARFDVLPNLSNLLKTMEAQLDHLVKPE